MTRENSVILIFVYVLIALSINEFIFGYKFYQGSQSKQMWYFLRPLMAQGLHPSLSMRKGLKEEFLASF